MITLLDVTKIEFQPIRQEEPFHCRRLIIHTNGHGKQEISLHAAYDKKKAVREKRLIPVIDDRVLDKL